MSTDSRPLRPRPTRAPPPPATGGSQPDDRWLNEKREPGRARAKNQEDQAWKTVKSQGPLDPCHIGGPTRSTASAPKKQRQVRLHKGLKRLPRPLAPADGSPRARPGGCPVKPSERNQASPRRHAGSPTAAWPLYTFAPDTKPGQIGGQGLEDTRDLARGDGSEVDSAELSAGASTRRQRTLKPSPVIRPMSLLRPIKNSIATSAKPITLARSMTCSERAPRAASRPGSRRCGRRRAAGSATG